MKRGSDSKSFLREPELTFINDDTGELQEVLKRGNDGKLLYSKKSIADSFTQKGFDKHLVFNAIYLQNYSLNQIKNKMQDLSDFLKSKGLRGILEFHANDTTQQSFHFHYWTNDDHWEIKRMIGEYILEHDFASPLHVNIQGQFERISEIQDPDEFEEAMEAFKNVPKAETLAITSNEQRMRSRRDNVFARLQKSVDDLARGRMLNARLRGEEDPNSVRESQKKKMIADIDGMSEHQKLDYLDKKLSEIKARRSLRNR